ncbi:ArsR/SmtB family transcription factor [Candidatus Korobacter versatilis]|nr:helix-turn-helix domain-containing protein [Candidatus Koribacter versatilis]
MEKRQFTRIAKALADPRRFEILQQIASEEEVSCAAVKECHEVTPATLSHHLKELESAGLVEVRKESKYVYLSLQRPAWKAYLKELKKIGR